MTTPAKIAANKRNARRSTGPKTPSGKAVAKMNALTHGFRAASPVVPGECPELWDQFRAAIVADLAPVGVIEAELADRVALFSWRLRRLTTYEMAAVADGSDREARRVRGEEPDEGFEFITGPSDAKPTMAQMRERVEWAEKALSRSRHVADLFARLSTAMLDTPVPGADALAALRALTDYTPDGDASPDEADFDADELPPPDPMADPDDARFLTALGVPDDARDDPEEWGGWTAGRVRLGAAVVASTVDWTGEKLLARAVRDSAINRDDEQESLTALMRQLADVERSTAVEEAEARRRALVPSATAEVVIKYDGFLYRQLTQTLRDLEDRQAARADSQFMPPPGPHVVVGQPLQLPAHRVT